ncbi:hypothetical protein BJM49_10685 [Listeria monocytogenes]|uniref:hypothetical protein n=1 Tax=Listeria TaxID=1637 RepID=UPI000874ABC0|nr:MULTISPECIES: hypothetical protein [Listeria]EAA0348495.1 hypothetical protein [Listeria monocytogenes]EAC3173701.1 hypothetical protein [Listeria monocytogenes]ECB9718329.1 hypothetical protein [Listeria monocytogenes]ECB9784386.1 hypothetical protein [Listeria monocytogenes]EGA6437195.1 hypothetical protein [Listeria monocytogenes]
MINELQKKIDEINYWDLLVLDIQSKYFGDEVYIYIEKDEEICWKLSFTSCYKVSYETDAKWRGDFKVRNTGPKSGYYAQDISLNRYAENEDFIECSFDASIMTMNIICKGIIVEEVNMADSSFFWKDY